MNCSPAAMTSRISARQFRVCVRNDACGVAICAVPLPGAVAAERHMK